MHMRGDGDPDFLLLANGEAEAVSFVLPEATGMRPWRLIADTAATPPADWTPIAEAGLLHSGFEHRLEARSVVLLAAP